MPFASLGLSPALVRAIARASYETPTPIQSQAVPAVLAGRDLLAAAQTGTGKTAAFMLPILHRLAAEKPQGKRRPRALILAPTRELAAQVNDSARTYGMDLPLRSTAIFGGVSMRPQMQALARGVDIVVATPGRLMDHMRQRTADLSAVEILVLDEADRMLDMGFIHDIRTIIAAMPAQRQNLLFSATYSREIRTLAATLLRDPVQIDVAPSAPATALVEQSVVRVAKADKRALLSYLIGANDWRQVLVFARTKHGADRLAGQLEQDGLRSEAMHGDKSQAARARALAAFKRGQVRVLVATDIAARGIDIRELPHVINYEMPMTASDYVHRIGRTGRAGVAGTAISLIAPDERGILRDVERLLRQTLAQRDVPGFASAAPVTVQTDAAPDWRSCAPRKPVAQPRHAHSASHPKSGHRAPQHPQRRPAHAHGHSGVPAARRSRPAARFGA